MNSSKTIQKFEYESLYIGESGFTKTHFDQLVSFNDNHSQEFFNVGNRKVTFKSFVGVVQVSGITIEILPKGDNKTLSEGGKDKWRSALINLLSECKKIKLKGSQSAQINIHRNSLLELYINHFLNELEEILHRGLIRKYDRKEGQKYALKGAIHFPKHISANFIHKERFYTRHQVYDYNHQLNRILKTALWVLKTLNISPILMGRVQNLDLKMESIGRIKSKSELDKQVSFSRKTDHYRDAVQLALLIIQEYSPILKAGENQIIAFLFNMNELFEEFIYRRLRKEEGRYADIELKVFSQQTRSFWDQRTIRPDVLITFKKGDENRSVILDTKWKLLDKINPSIDDLRQMFVYNLYFSTDRSILLYPENGINDQESIAYYPADWVTNESHGCEVRFVNPFLEDGRVDEWFSSELIRNIIYKNTS